MAGSLRYYWDTAPLVAWITDERRPDPAEMSGLAEVVEMVERGQAILMTSVLWRAEVLELKLSAGQRRRLESVFDGQSVVELQIDSQVMDLAGHIRGQQRLSRRKDVLQNVRVPDAIHLASAIHYEASEFHTFDGARRGTNSGGLLTLDGNVAGHRLRICTPRAMQLRLEESVAPEAGEP